LEKKVKACDEFLSATLLLKEALETEEMTAVNNLISRREKLVGIIDGLDRRIDRYRQAGLFAQDSVNRRKMIKYSEDIKRTLKQILSANQDCDTIAAGRCEGLRKDITSIRRKEEGFHGYSRSKEKTQKFLNIQA